VTRGPVSGGGRLARLARSVAGPVACAVLLTGLLSAWVATGGAGTLTRVRIQVISAAVPMRAYTPQAAAAVGAAHTFVTIRNLTATPDELVAVRSPVARHVALVRRDQPGGPSSVAAGLAIPGGRTITLSPFGDDVVLEDPVPYESSKDVPLTLVFRDAGTVTIQAPVTDPGTP
jgi:copper(I)-binding protein